MKESHQGLGIKEEEWQASVKDLLATLAKFKIPEKEQNELIAIIGSTKGDIVTVKAAAPPVAPTPSGAPTAAPSTQKQVVIPQPPAPPKPSEVIPQIPSPPKPPELIPQIPSPPSLPKPAELIPKLPLAPSIPKPSDLTPQPPPPPPPPPPTTEEQLPQEILDQINLQLQQEEAPPEN